MITTWSKFNYGLSISTTNNLGDFSEGGADLLATLDAGAYTIDELLSEIEDTLNASGALTYTCSVVRATGLVTIAATGTFQLLMSTGDNASLAFWSLLGFDTSSDKTGAATYTGYLHFGSQYYPQFLLQSYVPPESNKASLEPMVNRTASGRTELVRFGLESFIEFELKFITNLPMDGFIIKNNPNGLANLQSFLADISGKSRFEFVPDLLHPGTFYKVICETLGGHDATGFSIKELYAQNLPGVYETGLIKLRVVT